MPSAVPIEDVQKQSPLLVALHPSFMHRRYALAEDAIVLGRDAAQCDVVVNDATISRRHCAIEFSGHVHILRDLNSANGVFVNGNRIHDPVALNDGDLVGLGSDRKDHFRFQADASAASGWTKILPAKPNWTIGRASQNDIALPFETVVSSLHATLRNRNGVLEVVDNKSLNGTWLSGRRVKKARLRESDALTVGSAVLRPELLPDGRLKLDVREAGDGIALECVDLLRTIGGGWFNQSSAINILEKVTLSVRPGEFVGVLGPSGAGKSTLLKALNGYQRPNYGCVLLNDTALYNSMDSCKTWLGYVPQDDIVHRELTVEQTLHYTARLRLPRDVTASQRAELVDSTLESLGLAHVRDSRVQNLSGGQRKRVSIGCELLTHPSVLFLDEPTSGMDPSTEERLMRLFQDMAAHGTTILITTHILYNLSLLDRVIIMSRGRLVFFGTPREAMHFFSFTDTPVERPTRIFELLEGDAPIPDLPEDKQGDKSAIADYFHQKYAKSDYYRRNLEQQISPLARNLGQQSVHRRNGSAAKAETGGTSYRHLLEPTTFGLPKINLHIASLRILLTLVKRHFQVRFAFPKRLLFYLFVPIVLALVTGSLPAGDTMNDAEAVEKQESIRSQIQDGPISMDRPIKELLAPDGADDPRTAAEIVYALKHEGLANMPTSISVLLMFVMMAVFTGTLVACLEISAERPIFVRERMANLKIAEYVASKLPFLLLLTAVQCLLFLIICRAMIGAGHFEPIPTYLALVAMSWTACAMGLAVSAADPTPGQFSVILAIIVVLPQLVFSGGLGPDFYQGMDSVLRVFADATPARYGLEMLMSAFYDQPDRTALAWLPSFVRDTIGFEFGDHVYQRNALILSGQTLAWLLICGALLKWRKGAE